MIKRTLDIIASFVALVMLLPFIGLLCLVVGRNPLYSHSRYGKNKRIFTLFKIRTMNIPSPNDNRKIEDMQRDRRVTRVGKVLRSAHLDELPQLWNILKGDMSFVGPRPIPVIMTPAGIPNWNERSVIKPGLTGMAQLYCTKYTSLARKFHFDVLYVEKQSPWLDIKLLAVTSKIIMPLVAFVGCTVGILLATLLPIAEESIPGMGVIWGADKFAHFGMFMVWAIAAYWYLRSFIPRPLLSIFLLGGILAGGTEITQHFLPLRNMSFWDYVADMAGIGYIILSITLSRLPYEIQDV